jgi:DNA-binding NarL/FixJ family response regulator
VSGVVRVLVVDDQALFRAAMTSVVRETDGFEVVGEAASGEESLEAVATLAPELVLMDVHLAAMDGVEAARLLLAAPQPPVVVLLSTDDEDAGVRYVAASGAAAYLTKSALGPERLEAVWLAATAPSGGYGDS